METQMSRCDDKRYDVTSVRIYTSCVTSLFMPIIYVCFTIYVLIALSSAVVTQEAN